MRIENDVKLDFDDVLIRPKRSEAPSRKSVVLERSFKLPHSPQILTCIPICASNMDTVGTIAMAKALLKDNLLCCLHKFYPQGALISFFTSPESRNTFYTLGLREDDWVKFSFVNKQVPLSRICLDAANGHTKYFVQRVSQIRSACPEAIIMAGNVAIPEMVQELLLEGADIVKIGIGPGSVCTTRFMTGVGVPQLSAAIEAADAAHGLGGLVCIDGGIKTPGDAAKAIGSGGDIVMLGKFLAGTSEGHEKNTPIPDMLKFYGMSSKEAQDLHSGGVSDYAAAEGISLTIPYKGPVADTIRELLGSLRSSCAYIGAKKLKDFSKCCTFIRVNRLK